MPYLSRKGTRYKNKSALEQELRRPPIVAGFGPFYGDIGMIAVACGIGLAALIAGARSQTQTAIASSSASASESTRQQMPSQSKASTQNPLKPLTLDELLAELRKRLAQENVETKIDRLQGKIRLLSNAPMFALSQPNMNRTHASDARKIAEALAWAARCHIDFQEQQLARPKLPTEDCALGKPAATHAFADCLQDRGRVSVSHIRFEGHADSLPFRPNSQAEFTNNQTLSNARATRFADTVVTCAQSDLKQQGKPPTMPYEAIGLGAGHPAEKSGRDPRNRRIEVRFKTDSERPQAVEIQ